MNTVTSIHLRGVPSVRILTQDKEHFMSGDRLPSWVSIDAGGSEIIFHAQPGKLLALFRAIETALLENDPDSEIFFDGDRELDDAERLF
jgi:hypothetical protein